MANNRIIAKKNNGVWFWYNKEKEEYIRPVRLTDESFIKLNPKTKTEVRVYYEKNKGNKPISSDSNIIEKYNNLNKFLKKEITGQNKVIDQLTKSLSSNEFNGWDTPNVGLFMGSTGVGKTLLARKTNEFLNGDESNFLKIDCNNPKYQNPNYNKKNLEEIAEFIKNHPNGIILLDEFEKIILSKHPGGGYEFNGNSAFFNAFLNIFDDGYIVDSDNKKISCKKNTFIMTSNLGAEYLSVNDKMSMKILLNQIFPPEFLGRIDKGIYYFNTLRFKDLMAATKLVLNEKDGLVTKQLDRNKIQIKIPDKSLKNIVLASCGLFHNIDQLAYDDSAYFNSDPSEDLKQVLYFHESGHCITELAQMNEKAKKTGVYPVKKLTVRPEGNALGYSLSLPNEKTNGSRVEAIQEAICLHAGRAAEELFCNSVGEGWANDKTKENELICDIMLHFHTPADSQIPIATKENFALTKENGKFVFNKIDPQAESAKEISETTLKKEKGEKFIKEMKADFAEKEKAFNNTKNINSKIKVNKEDQQIIKDVSAIAGFDISKVSFSQYWTEDESARKEKIAKLEDSKQEWNEIFKAYEVYIQNKSRELLLKHEKELRLFVDALKTKGTLDEKEIKYIWDHKALPKNIIEIKNKPKAEQDIIKIDNGSEPVSSSAGVRAIKNWIKNELAFKFQELFEKGKVHRDSEVELIVDEDGKMSVKELKEKQFSSVKVH